MAVSMQLSSTNSNVWSVVKAQLQKDGKGTSEKEIADATDKVMKANNISAADSRSMKLGTTINLDSIATQPPAEAAPAAETADDDKLKKPGVLKTSETAATNNGTLNSTEAYQAISTWVQQYLKSNQAGQNTSNLVSPTNYYGLNTMNGLSPTQQASQFMSQTSNIRLQDIAKMNSPKDFTSSVQLGGLFGGVVNSIGGRGVMASRGFYV